MTDPDHDDTKAELQTADVEPEEQPDVGDPDADDPDDSDDEDDTA
jgi:hypothetical protein